METPQQERLLSLDVLRGFDMFWIVGGEGIIVSLSKRWPSTTLSQIAEQFSSHCDWAGFRFYDCIFPLFLFIIGATVPYSIGKRLEQGTPKSKIIPKLFTRFAILTVLGLVINGLLDLPGWDHMRLFGVLQRQAFGFLAVSLIYLYTKPKTQLLLVPAILLGYWAIMAWAPVPGFPHGTYSEHGNFANYVDRVVMLPGQLYTDYGDPEGPVSHLPSIATALLGLLAGTYLKTSSDRGERKAAMLVGVGAALFTLGWVWNLVFPVIKKIWTSSFACVAGGTSLMLLGIFFYVLDVKQFRRGATFFRVIGMNAIAAYMAAALIPFEDIGKRLLSGLMRIFPQNADLLLSLGSFGVLWLALWGLYKKGVFVRV